MANTEAIEIFVFIEHSMHGKENTPAVSFPPPCPTLLRPNKTVLRMVLGKDAGGPMRNVWDTWLFGRNNDGP